MNMLSEKSAYILDFENEYYVWVGKEVDDNCRDRLYSYAKLMIEKEKEKRPLWVVVERVPQGEISIALFIQFIDFFV